MLSKLPNIETCTLLLTKKRFQSLEDDLKINDKFLQVVVDDYEILVEEEIISFITNSDISDAVAFCVNNNAISCIVKNRLHENGVIEILTPDDFVEQKLSYTPGEFFKFKTIVIGNN